MTDAERLKKALFAVAEQLHHLPAGTPIQITKLPESDRGEDGSLYSVSWPTTFSCSRGNR